MKQRERSSPHGIPFDLVKIKNATVADFKKIKGDFCHVSNGHTKAYGMVSLGLWGDEVSVIQGEQKTNICHGKSESYNTGFYLEYPTLLT